MIPALFAPDLPPACRQVLLVAAPDERSISAELHKLERDASNSWKQVGDTIPVTLGRNGLAWGLGEHQASPPPNFRLKREGDGCSPAGVFRLPLAFGDAPTSHGRLRYVPITQSLLAVDDPQSQFYNQIVDSACVTKDWSSTEFMQREDGLYRHGIVVAHNPSNQPDAGSCIFIHLWRGSDQPTAGCTAMSEANLQRILAWLDPALEPRLVQWIA
ncbi:MAG: L,D-transpeptidase [Prosthecobacter sp.]|uniref:L,D-transpeptidase family protein n=1 Tax=Prosthecobacter sp. TaxID=1965333 RepID=UPI003900DBC5